MVRNFTTWASQPTSTNVILSYIISLLFFTLSILKYVLLVRVKPGNRNNKQIVLKKGVILNEL